MEVPLLLGSITTEYEAALSIVPPPQSVYYAFDNTTRTFESLKTKDKTQATRLLVALNEAGMQPAMNLSLARWQHVLEEIIKLKSGPTQYRWQTAAKDKAFDLIRPRLLIGTEAEHFLEVLKKGSPPMFICAGGVGT